MKHNPIIIALDVENATQARAIVDRLGESIDFYKVGMEIYAAEGMPFVRELLGGGKRVFLDLKLYDIGETVKRAVAVIAGSGVTFLSLHAMGAVMRAAVEGRADASLKLLGVTVLTSFDQRDLVEDGHPGTIGDLVARRTRTAIGAGIDGLVCSPLEAGNVRAIAGPQALIVTPGVRSRTADIGDQKRVATPAEAMAAGATHLVIGRQVTRALDPRAEVGRILEEIE